MNITRHPDTDAGGIERETGIEIESGTGTVGGETGTGSGTRNARTGTAATGRKKGSGNQSSGTNGTRPCTERKSRTPVPRAESGKRTTKVSRGARAMLDHVIHQRTRAARGGIETESANRHATRKGAGHGAETETLITTLRRHGSRRRRRRSRSAERESKRARRSRSRNKSSDRSKDRQASSKTPPGTEQWNAARGDAGRRVHVTEGTDTRREIAMTTMITNTDAEREGRNETGEWREYHRLVTRVEGGCEVLGGEGDRRETEGAR